jgi:molecular chaperone GrpE
MSKETYDPHAPGNGTGAPQPESAAPAGTAAQREAAAAEYSRQAGEQAPAAAVEPSALQALEAQVADLKDQVLRSYAEVDNIRKRGERERLDTQKYAVSKFARDMLSVADNLERALAAAPKELADTSLKGFIDGVTVTERSLIGLLERHGIKRIEAQGALFDPHLHQAVMEQPDPSIPSGTIVRVFEQGYLIEDRVLRPASVVVAKGGAKPTKPSAQDAGATPPNGGDQAGDSGYGNDGSNDPSTGA